MKPSTAKILSLVLLFCPLSFAIPIQSPHESRTIAARVLHHEHVPVVVPRSKPLTWHYNTTDAPQDPVYHAPEEHGPSNHTCNNTYTGGTHVPPAYKKRPTKRLEHGSEAQNPEPVAYGDSPYGYGPPPSPPPPSSTPPPPSPTPSSTPAPPSSTLAPPSSTQDPPCSTPPPLYPSPSPLPPPPAPVQPYQRGADHPN